MTPNIQLYSVAFRECINCIVTVIPIEGLAGLLSAKCSFGMTYNKDIFKTHFSVMRLRYVILNVGQTLMVSQENIGLRKMKCIEVSGVKLAAMNYSDTVVVGHKS